MAVEQSNGEIELQMFLDTVTHDEALINHRPWIARWHFIDALDARNERTEMNFKSFEGPAHLRKFLLWNVGVRDKDYFNDSLIGPYIAASIAGDRAVLKKLGMQVPEKVLNTCGRYNAQDYLYQRLYPVPERQTIRTILDFGGGLGRTANLAFGAPDATTEFMISVDAIPSTYLTQRVYYEGLGLRTAEYIEYVDQGLSFDIEALRKDGKQLVHLPTWQMELIEADSIDLVSCVQVLKELPQELFVHAARQFSRILKPGAALYFRDHPQYHNPNHMPITEILSAVGFVLEFRPHVRDRVDIQGLPQIWRKLDPSIYYRQ